MVGLVDAQSQQQKENLVPHFVEMQQKINCKRMIWKGTIAKKYKKGEEQQARAAAPG